MKIKTHKIRTYDGKNVEEWVKEKRLTDAQFKMHEIKQIGVGNGEYDMYITYEDSDLLWVQS